MVNRMRWQAFGCVKKNNNCVELEHTRNELTHSDVGEYDRGWPL